MSKFFVHWNVRKMMTKMCGADSGKWENILKMSPWRVKSVNFVVFELESKRTRPFSCIMDRIKGFCIFFVYIISLPQSDFVCWQSLHFNPFLPGCFNYFPELFEAAREFGPSTSTRSLWVQINRRRACQIQTNIGLLIMFTNLICLWDWIRFVIFQFSQPYPVSK